MTRAVRLFTMSASVALAVGCLILAYQEAHYSMAQVALQQWRSGLDMRDHQHLRQRLQRAGIGNNPAATLLDARASIMLAESMQADAADELRDRVLLQLEQVADRRPTDHQPWVLMAQILLRQGKLSSEPFAVALERAFALGPNESHTFAGLFPELWLNWYLLAPQQRRMAGEFALRTAWREPRWAMDTARRYGFLQPMCDGSAGNRLAMDHCRRLGWTPAENPQ